MQKSLRNKSPIIILILLHLVLSTFADTSTNLALDKTAKANSSEGNLPASMAFDSDIGTRWGSDWVADSLSRDSAWIYVDLGQKHAVDSVKITWENATASEFYIQVSDTARDNDSGWVNVAHIMDTAQASINELKFTAAPAQFVRMRGIHRITTYGYSIFQFEVYATNEVATTLMADKLSNPSFTGKMENHYLPNGQVQNNAIKKALVPTWRKPNPQ